MACYQATGFLNLFLCVLKLKLTFCCPACPTVRKDKLDVLGSRHVFLAKSEDKQDTTNPEDSAAAGELESVFRCSMLPAEYYMEMMHSLSAIGIVDVSPAQGPHDMPCLPMSF